MFLTDASIYTLIIRQRVQKSNVLSRKSVKEEKSINGDKQKVAGNNTLRAAYQQCHAYTNLDDKIPLTPTKVFYRALLANYYKWFCCDCYVRNKYFKSSFILGIGSGSVKDTLFGALDLLFSDTALCVIMHCITIINHNFQPQ